ncbi:MAG: DNA primase [Chlamydiales bacterium]|jgi:DNA primase
MPLFTKASLETLKQRIDIIEMISSHIDLKRGGTSYKALCPFHDEKSPSFTVQKGDTHYHCFGCGAHGDAIQFLMNYQSVSFIDAVESLAQMFHVHLEQEESGAEVKGPNKVLLKKAMKAACRFYQFTLLHTPEGHEALEYLYRRGLDLNFIRNFQVGLAPASPKIFRNFMYKQKFQDDILHEAGLIAEARNGGWRDFFYDRITFPILSPTADVIGFSARKYKDQTFGGKYVNSTETPLFKKSRTLYGLNFCRRRIAKERKAIIVEGQIDALRLIQAGFNITIAGQGTAFGEGHVKELLNLGVNVIHLALDADEAGRDAARKIGHLFQKAGVEVYVAQLPFGSDPDSILSERGPESFMGILEESPDYLTFLVDYLGKQIDLSSPAGKNELVTTIAKRIREWDSPLMVHESLRKLAHLAHVPEDAVGVGIANVNNFYIQKTASAGREEVDPNKVLEADFLRWLLVLGEAQSHFVEAARLNVAANDLIVPVCKNIYETYLSAFQSEKSMDLLSLAIEINDQEGQEFISEILQKKINQDKAEVFFYNTIQKILDRKLMLQREEVKTKLQAGNLSDEDALELAKEFSDLKREEAKVVQVPKDS